MPLALLALPLVALLIPACRAGLGRLLKLLARTLAALGGLAALKAVGGALGLGLGVNLFNALTVGLLGAPGLALLWMLNWVTRL